jgi:hypothetical protein
MPQAKKLSRITITLPEELLAAVDDARGRMGRSEFLRLALAEKLGMGDELVAAPDRVGKGGRPTHKEVRKKEMKVYLMEVRKQEMAAEGEMKLYEKKDDNDDDGGDSGRNGPGG